jgi:hypothetical protein
MSAHIPYANKIARAVIQENTFEGGKVDVVTLNLTKLLLLLLMKQGKQSFKNQFKQQVTQRIVTANVCNFCLMFDINICNDAFTLMQDVWLIERMI